MIHIIMKDSGGVSTDVRGEKAAGSIKRKTPLFREKNPEVIYGSRISEPCPAEKVLNLSGINSTTSLSRKPCY